jgi:predicted nucleic acid-binding protein
MTAPLFVDANVFLYASDNDEPVKQARAIAWLDRLWQAVNETLFRHAREVEQRWRISWWDSMVVAAAQMQYCTLLLTEDLQDGMAFGSVTVRSPFTLEVREAAASYAVPPRAASPHRPRGRPRRAVRESPAEL